MNREQILKNLKQIHGLLNEDSPYMANERIKWLINDIEKEDDTKYEDFRLRQGRSRQQEQDTEKAMFVSSLLLGATILGIVIWGLLS